MRTRPAQDLTRISPTGVAPATRTTLLVLAVMAAALLIALPARASDPPHWLGASLEVDCTSQCHVLHNATGGTLTSQETNSNLCLSCHNNAGLADGLSISVADKAVPHVSGTSHAFDVAKINSIAGADTPNDLEMGKRTPDDNIICSTCHNQHTADATLGGTPRIGSAGKVLATEPPGSGALAASGTFSGPNGVWYLIEIVKAGSQSTAEICYSKDNGTSWRPTGCDPPGSTYTPSQTANGATPVAIDDGFGVELTFSGAAGDAFKQGERWEFSASYPFLRVNFGTGGSEICAQCHDSWVMTTTDTHTFDGGVKSHPTGIAYSGTDLHTNPLDGNGQEQGPGDVDGNPTNDLQLFAGKVECLTCHGIHFVDSNTQTVDIP